MNREQVIDLLTIASAYDNRKPDETAVYAWHEAATRERWTWEEAREAVHDHYARSSEWLMPGHVTQRIKSRRQLQPPVSELQLEAAPPASEATRRRVMELVRRLSARKSVGRGSEHGSVVDE